MKTERDHRPLADAPPVIRELVRLLADEEGLTEQQCLERLQEREGAR
jgi:hypothetical protein